MCVYICTYTYTYTPTSTYTYTYTETYTEAYMHIHAYAYTYHTHRGKHYDETFSCTDVYCCYLFLLVLSIINVHANASATYH